MKNFIFSILLGFMSLAVIGQDYNLNISGYVTDEDSGEPLVQQMVNISIPGDSLSRDFYYFNTVFTDADGFFEDNIEVPDGETGTVYVETFSCDGSFVSESEEFSENSNELEFDFELCSDPSGGGDDCMAMYFYCPDSTDFMTINFVDMSMGMMGDEPSSWDWEFGDGTGSTEQNPVHTFADEGEYEVCLTITAIDSISGDTCESTYCSDVYVENWDFNCEAWFYYYPLGDDTCMMGCGDGLTLQFMDYSWGNPSEWEWDFGDGTTSNEQNPIHEYATGGEYQVCLSISSDSCESSYCETVYVSDDGNNDCYSWFEYETTDLSVDFSGYLMSGDSTVTYSWDFGDGEYGTGQSVTHVFAEAGMYFVNLTAQTADSSCFADYAEIVWVGESFSFAVFGNVYLEDSLMADFADVYLMTFDTLGDNLVNVATTQIDADGYYEFDGVGLENCIYFVQSELTDASAYYGDYLPTYHLSALNWEDAWPVFPMPMGFAYDIYMLADSNVMNSGSAIINGLVNSDESRGLMSDVEILLMDENKNPITYLRTDENGNFQFRELQYGTYIVYTEIVGIRTTPALVTLSPDSPQVDITIVVANGEAVLGVGQQSDIIEDLGEISPNPVSDNAYFNISLKEGSTIKLEIMNQFGQVLSSKELNVNQGETKINLQTSTLKQGFYFVNITPSDGIKSVRKFIKIR